jgi:hypothetical protein
MAALAKLVKRSLTAAQSPRCRVVHVLCQLETRQVL